MEAFNKFSYENGTIIDGLTRELSVFYVLECFKKTKKNIIVLTSNLYDANRFYRSLVTYTNSVLLFPMDDFFITSALAVSPELKMKRLETIEQLENGNHIVVTNLMGYLKYLPNHQEEKNTHFKLKVGDEIARDKIVERFEALGYKRDSLVTSTGEYAVRGFVIDVFLFQEVHPIRIEFFGDTIDSIRYFDEETQRTIADTDEIICEPIDEMESQNPESILDYMKDATLIVFDKDQLLINYRKLLEENILYNKQQNLTDINRFWNYEDLQPAKEIEIDLVGNRLDKKGVIHYQSKDIDNFKNNFEKLHDMVIGYVRSGKTVIFALSKEHEVREIHDLFEGNVTIVKNGEIKPQMINILSMKINHGFIWDDLVVISEYDVEEVTQEVVYKNNLHIGKKIKALDSINVGDYVVHRVNGIGIYQGVVTLENHGVKKDYIQISYLDNDKVYIPVEKISSIYKYSDKDGSKPQINKLGSTSWEKKKKSIQKRIHDISQELIELYAKRNAVQGDAYIDYSEEDAFASEFIYDETRDQTRAIYDIKKDLDSHVPMDRLLCGDVGFGKTEVAFRAMFKAVCNNKQVLYLCPTTILSKQQYESAKERFHSYPVEIALLNRFTTSKETKEIIEGLASGKIDIVIGTHRLLSNDIHCKKLGLLIIDEEQRFGVTHKEKIKKMKNDVNVLTLSATPIPRTMKMALSGLRDLSIIDTPPINRYPVQTYVIAENDLLVKDAIYKELARDGQTFILYNHIDKIEEEMYKIQKLVPEARIRYGHGQMDKQELDQIMDDFVSHKFDILISTTIIETGIDIPNANTLIIYDADHFGLSQLYQLRGRVGRSNRIAYAYLLYDNKKMLNDIAVKRLQAIRDFTELGSGYKIAMRDLSIRGAGDLLGSEQAGFVDSVGISLYLKMIEEEMAKLKGEEIPEDDTKESLINVETHIDNHYVSDEEVKIEIHQMINEIDSYSKLEEVKAELEDRFGKISEKMEIYMYEEWFEKLAGKLHIKDVVQNEKMIQITIPEEISNQIKGDKLFMEAYNINPKFQLKYEHRRIMILLNIWNEKKHFIYDVVSLLQLIVDDLNL